jgi:hypothetical protein
MCTSSAEAAARLMRGLAELPEDALQSLFAALVRDYAVRRRAGNAVPFTSGQAATEDVLVTVAEMLRAADVTSFELAALFDV